MTETAPAAPSPAGKPPGAAVALGAYAAALRYPDLPGSVVERIEFLIADTIIACLAGARQPAGEAIARHAATLGRGGADLFDGSGRRTSTSMAALANGVLAHAAEADALRRPGAGVHPGATIVPAALALAQELGRGGREVIAAVAAAVEVMFRIGRATHHGCEARGFHAPGLTGPFGAAVACAHLLRLPPDGVTNALAIAGSLAGGLLEFAVSDEETMVKPLHIGRAAESGLLAARLAAGGMRGPSSVLDGRFGFLSVYCATGEPALLTADLGARFESETICFKRYPCHISAHAPVEGMLDLQRRHGLDPAAVASIHLEVSAKTAGLHDIARPGDVGLARYSICFCAALALTDDPRDPMAYGRRLHDPATLDLAARVSVTARSPGSPADPWSCGLTVNCRDGRCLTVEVSDFFGTPTSPFGADDLEQKLRALAPPAIREPARAVLERLLGLKGESTLDWLEIAAPGAGAARAPVL